MKDKIGSFPPLNMSVLNETYKFKQGLKLRRFLPNTIFHLNNKSSCRLIGILDRSYYDIPTQTITYFYVLVQFTDGTIVCTTKQQLAKGMTKNPNRITVAGVGFLGEGKHIAHIKGKETPEHSLWDNMLRRVYALDFTTNRYRCYKDVTVDPRWHNFQNFCEDIQHLEGYAEWKLFGGQTYQLDKDVLSEKAKIYSKETCKFITASENSIASSLTGKTYIAHRLSDGYEEEFTNQKKFAIKYSLTGYGINKCLKGVIKSHKGWVFTIKGEEIK